MKSSDEDAVESSKHFVTSLRCLRENLLEAWKNGEDCDFIIYVEGREIKTNKFILNARCKWFERMFDLKGKEVHDGHVTLSNFTYDVIYEMVHFMYSGYSPNLNRLCADLFIASDYYEMDDLKDMCENALSNYMDPQKAISAFISARQLKCEELEKKAIEFIVRNIENVENEPTWEEMSYEDSKYLLGKIARSLKRYIWTVIQAPKRIARHH